MNGRCGSLVEVIAVQRDVDLSRGNGLGKQPGEFGSESCAKVNPPFLDAENEEAD